MLTFGPVEDIDSRDWVWGGVGFGTEGRAPSCERSERSRPNFSTSQSTDEPLPWARTCAIRAGTRSAKAGGGAGVVEISRDPGSGFGKRGGVSRPAPPGGGISHLCEGDGVRGGGGVADSGGTPDDVSLELVRAVLDAGLGLRAGQRAVDSGRRFRAVAAQKGAFVEEHDAAAVLEDGVRGGEPREASADDDDLFGHGASFPSLKTRKRVRAGGVVVWVPAPRILQKANITRKVSQQTRSKIHRSGRRG